MWYLWRLGEQQIKTGRFKKLSCQVVGAASATQRNTLMKGVKYCRMKAKAGEKKRKKKSNAHCKAVMESKEHLLKWMAARLCAIKRLWRNSDSLMQLRDSQIPKHEYFGCILCKSGLLVLTGVMRSLELLNTIWKGRYFLMPLLEFYNFGSK